MRSILNIKFFILYVIIIIQKLQKSQLNNVALAAVAIAPLLPATSSSSVTFMKNLNKRSLLSDNDGNFDDLFVSADQNNHLQNSFDEYPMIVPKRAAIVLDRLMVALHHALEDEKDGSRKISDVYGSGRNNNNNNNNHQQYDKDKFYNNNNNIGFVQQQSKMPSTVSQLTSLSDEIEKGIGRYDIYNSNNEGLDGLNVRDLKSIDENDYKKVTNENDTSGRSNGRVYWRCYFNAVSCF